MGTRADFYVGKGKKAEWIGSIAWDGYRDGIAKNVLSATSADQFRAAVARFFIDRDDVTFPARGWPWPWETSATTDCSYWFFDGQVWDAHGGRYIPCNRTNVLGQWIDYPKFGRGGSAEVGSKRSGMIVIRD